MKGAGNGSGGSTGVARRVRPANRKQQIADNARDLFVRDGFYSVRMEDIAEASGITVRALYRHYANKEALLSHVVTESQGRYLDALSDDKPLEGLLGDLAAAALDSRQLAVLWQREARHLNDDGYAAVRRRLVGRIAETLRVGLTARLGRDDPSSVELYVWAILGILASPGHHSHSVPRSDFDGLLVAACETVVRVAEKAPAPSGMPPRASAAPGGSPRRTSDSRREQLLRAAAQAFRRHGYQAVGIDDIGAAEAGIAGPAIYRYFDSKVEVLETLIARLDEWLALETMRALRDAPDDREAIGRLLAGHVRVALDAPDLVSVTVTESDLLPEPARNRARRAQADREAEWLRWFQVARPDVPEAVALILVNAAMFGINDTARVPHLFSRPDLEDALTGIAVAVLLDTEVP